MALGAFVWFLILSIQFPEEDTEAAAPEEMPQRLRKELASRSENVRMTIGDITINAAVQENYKNGEIHFREFTMVQERSGRTVTISGYLSQTVQVGSEVDFMEILGKEGGEEDVRVVSSDGLDLKTATLNYVNSRNRIFTQTPADFTLKNLQGRAGSFDYYTDKKLLLLEGEVSVTHSPGDEEPQQGSTPAEDLGAGISENEEAAYEETSTHIVCNRLRFDQEDNSLALYGGVEVSQPGSFLRSERIEARLSEDNRQFERLVAHGARARARDEEEDNGDEEDDSEGGSQASVEHGASGIKKLKAERLTLGFSTGEKNLLTRAVAEGDAELDLQQAAEKGESAEGERKSLKADRIEATIGPEGKGIRRLHATSEEGLAEIVVRPPKRDKPSRRDGKKADETKRMTAPEITADVDPESGDFTFVTMSGGLELHQGDTVVTGSNARLDAAKDDLFVKGNPVLKDPGKRVESGEMNVKLDIGSLKARESVVSTFYPPETEEQEENIFAIGDSLDETTISAGDLDLDYKNNVLRYGGGVRALQGESKIDCQNLHIFQEEIRLVAIENVKATLVLPKEEAVDGKSGEEVKADKDEKEVKDRKKSESRKKRRSGKKTEREMAQLTLAADRLDLDKKSGVLSLVKNVNAKDEGMEMSCQHLRYYFGEEGGLKRAFAQGGVKIKIGPKTITGEKADYYIAEQVLHVTGKNVSLEEKGQMEANHNKLTLDMANDTLKFDASADKLLRTRVLTN